MAHDHDADPALAEAIARRDESRAQILRSKAVGAGNSIDKLAAAYGKLADKATADATKSAEAAGNIETPVVDPEGTARPLADTEGNFAANAEVSATGGIGIDASNTNVETGKPAQTAEEAGVATQPGAQKVIGDRPVDGTAINFDDKTVPELRAYAEENGIDLGDATRRADILAKIEGK